jgi:hypothetical protein
MIFMVVWFPVDALFAVQAASLSSARCRVYKLLPFER